MFNKLDRWVYDETFLGTVKKLHIITTALIRFVQRS